MQRSEKLKVLLLRKNPWQPKSGLGGSSGCTHIRMPSSDAVGMTSATNLFKIAMVEIIVQLIATHAVIAVIASE